MASSIELKYVRTYLEGYLNDDVLNSINDAGIYSSFVNYIREEGKITPYEDESQRLALHPKIERLMKLRDTRNRKNIRRRRKSRLESTIRTLDRKVNFYSQLMFFLRGTEQRSLSYEHSAEDSLALLHLGLSRLAQSSILEKVSPKIAFEILKMIRLEFYRFHLHSIIQPEVIIKEICDQEYWPIEAASLTFSDATICYLYLFSKVTERDPEEVTDLSLDMNRPAVSDGQIEYDGRKMINLANLSERVIKMLEQQAVEPKEKTITLTLYYQLLRTINK